MASRLVIFTLEDDESKLLMSHMATQARDELVQGKKTDFTESQAEEGPLYGLLAFNLGKRSGLTQRLQVPFVSLERDLAEDIWSYGDYYVFHLLGAKLSHLERLFAQNISADNSHKPIIISGLDVLKQRSPFLAQVFELWIRRNFMVMYSVNHPRQLLRDGLEWVLSF